MNKPVALDGVTAAETVKRHAAEVSPNKRDGRWEQIRLQMLIRRYPLLQRPITSITGPDIADWRDARLIKVSPSTVNRELCLISTMFTQAMKEWRLGLIANPCSQVTKPRKPRPRTQCVSIAERKRIVEQLGWDGVSEPQTSSQWVAFAFFLALETAMRKGEILSLRWADIDFEERYARLDITKNGDERNVPLSKAAMALLRIVKKRQPTMPVVPVQTGHFDKLFRDAKRDAGLSQIHFHDSRREAAIMTAPKLSNVLELAAITGRQIGDDVHHRQQGGRDPQEGEAEPSAGTGLCADGRRIVVSRTGDDTSANKLHHARGRWRGVNLSVGFQWFPDRIGHSCLIAGSSRSTAQMPRGSSHRHVIQWRRLGSAIRKQAGRVRPRSGQSSIQHRHRWETG